MAFDGKFDRFYDTVGDFVKGSVDSARNFLGGDFRMGVFEDPEEYRVEAVLPGIAKERVSVTIDAGRLRIVVNPAVIAEDMPAGYFRNEKNDETLERNTYLEHALDDHATAKMEDGILYVTVKKVIKEDTSQNIDID